uniref:Gem-associated protein 2 n=1 Tax=Auxenochlorella protothecoides TaxID=3075 RepID=A0A1D2A8I1_AUXPR
MDTMDPRHSEDASAHSSYSSSGDEEDDRRAFSIWQALPVPDREPDWAAEEVDSVEEYLCRVRWEAQHLPNAVVSTVDPPTPASSRELPIQLPDLADPEPCDPALLPLRSWTTHFLATFEHHRSCMQREVDADRGKSLLGTSLGGSGIRCPSPIQGPDPGMPSSYSGMPELEALRMLSSATVAQRVPSRVTRLVKAGFDPGAAAELFALSIRVETPLQANTCAAYRRLLRHCCSLRAGLGSDAHTDLLPHLNILVVICTAVFGQGVLETRD